MLAEERRKEREYQQMLEKQEEINLGLNQSFPNLQQEEFNFNNNIFNIVIQEVQAEIQEDQNKNEPDNYI